MTARDSKKSTSKNWKTKTPTAIFFHLSVSVVNPKRISTPHKNKKDEYKFLCPLLAEIV
jgi:hypothetical protein